MSLKEKINIVASENMTNKDVIQYLALNNEFKRKNKYSSF